MCIALDTTPMAFGIALLVVAAVAGPARASLTAYVANALDGTVSVVDVHRGTSLATVPVGCGPRDLVAHPDRSRVYVANTCADDMDPSPGSVSVIDTATRSVIGTFAVPYGPVALAVDASRQRLYAACLTEIPFSDEDSSGTLFVADLATGAPLDLLPLFMVPSDFVLTRDGMRAFVSGVAGFRDDEGNVQLNFSGVINVGVDSSQGGPTYAGAGGHFDIHPSGETLYVIDQTTNELAIVDAATASEVTRLLVGVAAQGVFFDRARRRAYVTSAGDNPNALPDTVTAIDIRSNTVATTFDGGWAPTGVTRAGAGMLLVTNFYSGELLVMRARTGALVRTIAVGAGANAVAVVR